MFSLSSSLLTIVEHSILVKVPLKLLLENDKLTSSECVRFFTADLMASS